ncbi:AraC family transcriptional regulator [Paenibacillus tepidiphilus]|uniref:AraC family transcriptional regulator n=1 Tax=Paenibacillus tepidiphilus TaxID=2608683 RepID=UPI00123C5DB3|nr:AraC family transcriptional regulator [Paenibacillus tepidiphilus]
MERSWSVEPIAYTYWKAKPQFLLDSDTYPHWTLFAVEEGKFRYHVGNREGEAEFGDLVLCPPGTLFGRRTLTPLTFHFVQFNWEEEPAAAERELLTGRLSVIDRSRLHSTYTYMRQYGEHWQEMPPADRGFRHLLNDVWWLIERESGEAPPGSWGDTDPAMQHARQWMLDHAYAPFSMRTLSELAGMTPVQFTRRFRAAFLMNPSEFVSALRIERACKLLGGTRLSLDSIAQQCGYENGFYLSRVFRQKKGMNPSQYRKLHQV